MILLAHPEDEYNIEVLGVDTMEAFWKEWNRIKELNRRDYEKYPEETLCKATVDFMERMETEKRIAECPDDEKDFEVFDSPVTVMEFLVDLEHMYAEYAN